MQRVLTLTPIFVALLLGGGCHSEQFHSYIENRTGHAIYMVIQFANHDSQSGRGEIETGNRVNLTQRLADINAIEYRFNGLECHLGKQDIDRVADVGANGMNRIVLTGCASPAQR